MVVFKVVRVETTPIDGQKPGTSGLRKKVRFPLLQFNYNLLLCLSEFPFGSISFSGSITVLPI
jgi:hypothetical protein